MRARGSFEPFLGDAILTKMRVSVSIVEDQLLETVRTRNGVT